MAKSGWTVKITPRFNTKEIHDKTIGRFWIDFQTQAWHMGEGLHRYMISYINSNCKRAGSTGQLEKAITHDTIHGAGIIGFGIGNMDILNAQAKHWYVINFGKKITGEPFIPFNGKIRPIEFVDGPADPSKVGVGNSQAIKFRRIQDPSKEPRPSIIRPMHYIEATQRLLLAHTKLLLARLRTFKL